VHHDGETIDLGTETADVVLLKTKFTPDDINDFSIVNLDLQEKMMTRSRSIIEPIVEGLKTGGILFVHGAPKHLVFHASCLNGAANGTFRMVFKNWIAIDQLDIPRNETMKPSHAGTLMYVKALARGNQAPFHVNSKEVRARRETCKHCHQDIKDWGGKKHLENPIGSCLSDVWRDFPRSEPADCEIPLDLESRIYEYTKKEPDQDFDFVVIDETRLDFPCRMAYDDGESLPEIDRDGIENDVIVNSDCISFLSGIVKDHPGGIFDLVFADPPYNLSKNYSGYDDAAPDADYIKWCESWLDACCNALRPGGSLLVLNLPKWSIHHARFLMQRMEFRHWIAWDALSSPAGKMMPAHYALLYFTKPGGTITFNHDSKERGDRLNPIDSRRYCSRQKCIKERKRDGDCDTEELTDVWWDIPRIRHSKERDDHPCQLPLALMHRIINMTTNEDDLVFDPFSGAGTTAVSARMFERHFISTDIDAKYVEISRRNLDRIIIRKEPSMSIVDLASPDLDHVIVHENCERYMARDLAPRKRRREVPSRSIEMRYFDLCEREGKIITEDELPSVDNELSILVKNNYPSFKTLAKKSRRNLEMHHDEEKNVEKSSKKRIEVL
jgi:site-specific DNA-methyltransferase (adenine-specific)